MKKDKIDAFRNACKRERWKRHLHLSSVMKEIVNRLAPLSVNKKYNECVSLPKVMCEDQKHYK